MLKKLHLALRVAAYVTGLAGMFLFTSGRKSAGGALVIGSFFCFVAAYVCFVLSHLGRGGR